MHGCSNHLVYRSREPVRKRLLDHQCDTEQRRDDNGTRTNALEQSLDALLSDDPVDSGKPPLVRSDARSRLSLQPRLDDIQRGGGACSNNARSCASAECTSAGNFPVLIGDLPPDHTVERKVDDRERHIPHEGRNRPLVHPTDAHFLDHVAQHRHLIHCLPRSGLIHLHPDLGDLHGGSDDDLACPSKTSRSTLAQHVALWVHRLVVNLEVTAEEVVSCELDGLLRHDPNDVRREATVERPHALCFCNLAETVEEARVLARLVHLELSLGHVERIDSGGTGHAAQRTVENILGQAELRGRPDGCLGGLCPSFVIAVRHPWR
mmetsp:Transcript_40169/g.98708  ORF Transcript_40169/g.98708 Transcript_40169/m.98708 type:complete len:321 (+) Transcript_40169:159-1121(+)